MCIRDSIICGIGMCGMGPILTNSGLTALISDRMAPVQMCIRDRDGAIICNPDNRNPTEHKWQNFCQAIGISEERCV